MLPWRDHSAANKVLVIAFAIVGGYVFLTDGQNQDANNLLLALLPAVFVYHFVDFSRARKKRENELAAVARKQPALASSPESARSGDIPDDGEFSVYDVETGAELGRLTGPLLRELVAFHEECGMDANDFYVLAETPTMIVELGKSKLVAELLVKWLNGRDSMQIRWIPNTRP